MIELLPNGIKFLIMNRKKREVRKRKLFCIYTMEVIIFFVKNLIVLLQALLLKNSKCKSFSNQLSAYISKSISHRITRCI
ncbi:hypothetical protein GLOIN_2v1881632 [Rhizophagus irregularis DAOM 181602=DAOM 197198]|uniref:Uncharacterized protein n=1 Tax=Rhizophagus irregularis (strain DAOM 181602 / DAOM 197198 / MUCL 43194) TaxID=747089 RepID=A0A2P4PF85_RHIID|nr:hypothetical protein GLOIN_2v1881632 [Rhizophagus irregularis DAOM 181602=DAOM 197198]POG64058.1 hypothetical protein GLOIN_2v1881632 [Rhizophagus irregularis DAOM 181602=DAOM 197198]|eukprot:XP_025170924.1 hypothetical protein GLOIN_2v1881632 [Rhizophagus irregularis DAOM 181602=DAOM 197198]